MDGGWLRSSDLGRIDPAGNLVLVGRAGDMYIRGGYNVYPLEVENVLTEHPAVDQASVVGVAAPVIGEIGVAFVVLDPGGALRRRTTSSGRGAATASPTTRRPTGLCGWSRCRSRR